MDDPLDPLDVLARELRALILLDVPSAHAIAGKLLAALQAAGLAIVLRPDEARNAADWDALKEIGVERHNAVTGIGNPWAPPSASSMRGTQVYCVECAAHHDAPECLNDVEL